MSILPFRISRWVLLELVLLVSLCALAPSAFARAQEMPLGSEALPADVRVEGSVTAPRLVIGDRTVLDRPGHHVGPPQVSPDGSLVAVTVVPAGTETDRFAQIYLFERHSARLLEQIPGHTPRWQAGQRFTYEIPTEASVRGAVYDVRRRRSILAPQATEHEPRASATIVLPPVPPPTYPETIRVLHHPSNNCRQVPIGQVDVIPFEEYVARAVPAEVPADWPLAALKAQAVAARTYAWYQIQQQRPDYDVSDWANFQMMCDDRYARTDQAVEETRGQYLTAQEDAGQNPIIAMYSAKNGHPTLDHPRVGYLRAVPDWTGLGEARWGHGYGMSQWGAQRRALAGQTYRQILGHYYTGVDLQNAQAPDQALGGLTGMEPGGYLPGGGIRWGTLAPRWAHAARIVVSSTHGLTRTAVVGGVPITVTDPLTLEGRSGVWHGPFDLPDGTTVQVSLWLDDARQDELSLQVDRTPPAQPTLTGPDEVASHRAPIAVDGATGSSIGLSSAWTWQAEDLRQTDGTGVVVADAEADGGAARLAQMGVHTPGYWYGPYTMDLPPAATYRALFRLRLGEHAGRSADNRLPDRPVARLDVTDAGGEVRLGLRAVWASDFPGSHFVEIPVDFHLFEQPKGLEFRVQWTGEADLALDRVRVFQLLPDSSATLDFPLARGETPMITAVAFDAAKNVSAAVTHTVRVLDDSPPTFVDFGWSQDWQTSLPVTLTATVHDAASGLDTARGRLLIDGDSLPVTYSNASDPGAQQQIQAIVTDVTDGEHSVQFEVVDRMGHEQQSPTHTLRLDRSGPQMAAHVLANGSEPIESSGSWFGETVQVELLAQDDVSGVAAVAYVLDGAPFQYYTEPFALAAEGMHAIRYWGQDNARNYSDSHFFDVGIDRTPPAVSFSARTGREQATIDWQVTDAGAGVQTRAAEIRRGSEPWQPLADPAASSVTLAFAEAESVSVRVRASDRVGNQSGWIEKTVTPSAVDLYLPAIVR